MVLRGEGLSGAIQDTDPQETGIQPAEPQATAEDAEKTADLVRDFLDQASDLLADQHPANMLLLRGFATLPDWPTMAQAFGLKGLGIAAYPMYRGVSRLIGMDTITTHDDLDEEFDQLEQHWDDYDFFYVHVKKTDSAGEDGDFQQRVDLIEAADAVLPRLLDLKPDVILVTGDHSTPAALKSHSWHPVPVLLWSEYCRPDGVQHFGEMACLSGALGPRIAGADLMPLALANALRLEKFGA
jgi:2,3-bisphosphoglycerate-independent phosphoglycerate mutase